MRQPRVLIIDDNSMNIQPTTSVLSRAAFVVDSAGEVNQGAATDREIPSRPDPYGHPDAGHGRTETDRRLKAAESTKRIRLVAFTAYAMTGDEVKMRAAGCDGYIAKPIDVRTFADKVRSYIAAESDGGLS